MSKKVGRNIEVVILLIIIPFLILTLYLFYRISVSERQLFSITYLALIAGVLFESFRISEKWNYVIYTAIGAFIFSLICLFPNKHEFPYNLENHLETWPYFFLGFFVLGSVILHDDQIKARLNEGKTLILSISVLYWTIDYGFTNIDSWFVRLPVIIGFLFFCLFFFPGFNP